MRWFVGRPTAVAYSSSTRQPGSVLRVSSTRQPVPSTAFAKRRARVATPHMRCRKFSAVRSAARIERSEPRTTSSGRSRSRASPSGHSRFVSSAGSTAANTASAIGSPQTTSASRASTTASPVASARSTASEVTSPVPRSSASARSTSAAQLARGGTLGSLTAGAPGGSPVRTSRTAQPLEPRAERLALAAQPRVLLALGGDHVGLRLLGEVRVGELAGHEREVLVELGERLLEPPHLLAQQLGIVELDPHLPVAGPD